MGLLASRVDRLTRTGREAVSRGDVTLATGERETMEVFAASVLTGPTYRGRSVQLVFGDAWSYGLDRPVALQVDPGDGQQYVIPEFIYRRL